MPVDGYMLRIVALGKPETVGKTSFLIEYNSSRLLMDYGVELTRPPRLPLHVKPRDIDCFYISHAHLDHMGAAPYLYVSRGIPLYATYPTIELSSLLVKDFLKLSEEYLPYEYLDYLYMRENWSEIDYNQSIEIPNTPFELEFLDAGHIPGSTQVIINAGKHRVLYTSDINTYDTRLQKPADTKYRDVDIVILESTYADEIHPNRKMLERRFIEHIEEIIDNGGIALVPSFAIGRSQEVLLILYHNKFKGKVSIDGMAITATNMILKSKRFIKDYNSLKKAFNRVDKIVKWKDRRRVVKDPGVIIAPAGMLGGGAAVFYMNQVYESKRNGIFLVGYQALGTPGRALLEEKVIFNRGMAKKVKSQVYNYRFSSHTDKKGLTEILKNLDPGTKIIIVHGEPDSRVALKYICEDLNHETYLPKMGEVIDIY